MGICKVGAESHGAFTHPPAGYILPHGGAKLRPEAGRHGAGSSGPFLDACRFCNQPQAVLREQVGGGTGSSLLGAPWFQPSPQAPGLPGVPMVRTRCRSRVQLFPRVAQAASASPPGFLSKMFPEGLSLSLQSIPLSHGLQTCALIATLVGFQEGDCLCNVSAGEHWHLNTESILRLNSNGSKANPSSTTSS